MWATTICPPVWASTFQKGADRMMVLAQWVLEYPEYAAFVKRASQRGAFVLMDNGAFEGAQAETGALTRAANACGATEVVLPDVIGDPTETLKRSWAALGQVSSHSVMFVPQGRDIAEWSRCLDAWVGKWDTTFWKDDYKLTLGIATPKDPPAPPVYKARASCLQVAAQYGFPMHMLGVGSVSEFALHQLGVARRAGVRSVDTSLAFALGAHGHLLTASAEKVPLGDIDQYDTLSAASQHLIWLNIAILEDWVQLGYQGPAIPMRLVRGVASRYLKYYARGFAPPEKVLRACCVPEGEYAIFVRGVFEEVRPLGPKDEPTEEEGVIEITYKGVK